MAVTRRYLQLAGHATEVITVNVSGRKQTVGLQVLVWPGNPGAAGYYVPFMEALSQALQGRASVAAVSNLGQCTEGIPGKTFTLQEQAAHKLRYVREHALGPGRPPLCIVGHSIGAYVALQNLRALEAERAADQLQQVVALFPFLCFDTASWRQWALEHLAAWPRTAGAVLGAVGALPTAVPRALLRTLAPDLDTHAVEKTLGMLSYRHGRNALVLAGHEFRDLRPSPDWPWLQSLAEGWADGQGKHPLISQQS